MGYDRIAQLDDNQLIDTISKLGTDIQALKNRQYIGGAGIKTYSVNVSQLARDNFHGGNTVISTDTKSHPTDAKYDFKHTLPAVGAGNSVGVNFYMTFTPDSQQYPIVIPGAYMYIDSPDNIWDLTDFTNTGVYGGFYVTETNISAEQPSRGIKKTGQSWTIAENQAAFTTFYFDAQRWSSPIATTVYAKAFVIATDTGTLKLFSDDSTFGVNDAF